MASVARPIAANWSTGWHAVSLVRPSTTFTSASTASSESQWLRTPQGAQLRSVVERGLAILASRRLTASVGRRRLNDRQRGTKVLPSSVRQRGRDRKSGQRLRGVSLWIQYPVHSEVED